MSKDNQVQQGDTPNDAPPVVTLTAADVAELEQYRSLGDVDEVRSIAAQAQDLAQRGRDLRVAEMVAAFEGSAEHDGIVQVEGRRHYPVVVAAAEEILRGVSITDVMAAGDETLQVDEVVVELLNAIPAEARFEIPTAPPATNRAGSGADSIRDDQGQIDPDRVTPEMIDALDKELSGAA